MKPLTFQQLRELHKEKFGQYPIVTGIKFAGSGDLIDRVVDALETGIPYIEQEIPKGIDT